MKLFKIGTVTLLFGSILISGFIFGREPVNRLPSLYKSTVASTGQFDVNRVRDDLENNGMIVSHRISGHSGMEWPKENSTYTVFASGVWMAGLVNNDIRTAAAEYAPENVPGPYGSDANDPAHKLYKVNLTDMDDPLGNDDFQNWPVELGAPWVDADSNGVWEPLPSGPDYPEFLGDQMIWYVSNDGDPTGHSTFNTSPLGVEVQTLIFGFDRPDAFGDMMFVKELVINKGGNTINDMYMGVWSDPDLGDAADDFVGCDTTLGMGICYNDGVDNNFAGYTGGTPAVGYDFFQGPIVPSAGDTAKAFGTYIPDYKNLQMTSFSKYINTSDEVWSDPETATEMYNLMQGLMKSGDPFSDDLTGGSNFVHPGDPTKDTGPDDEEYVDQDVHSSDDRRFLMNAGPFTMVPGDSQEVVFGIMMAAAGEALQSYSYLKQIDALAQFAYDNDFILPPPPPKPEVEVTRMDGEILLTWGTDSEDYKVDGPEALDGTPTYYEFQGYNVWQFGTESGGEPKKLLATYDVIDGIGQIKDLVFDKNLNELVNKTIIYGSDGGIKRSYNTNTDALNNELLKNNRMYYFGVTAYGYDEVAVQQRVLESSAVVHAVRPQKTNKWMAGDSTGEYGDMIDADHAGPSDGSAAFQVINPKDLTGHDYQITFNDMLIADGDTFDVVNWTLRDVDDNVDVLSDQTIQGGLDGLTGETVGDDANQIVDGIQVIVSGPPLGTKLTEEWDQDGNIVDDNNSILNPSLGSTGYLLSNRAGAVNQPPYARDWDRFGYWGMDDLEIDFSDSSLTWDYLSEAVHFDSSDGSANYAPFAIYRHVFTTGEVIRLFAGFWDSDGDGTWNNNGVDWAGPIYGAPSYEPIYAWQGYDASGNEISYDPANEAQYITDNSLATSANTTWGSATGEFVYPYVTAMLFTMYLDGATPPWGNDCWFITNKPNTSADDYTFSTSAITGVDMAYKPDNIGVWPNPYFGYNPEERTPVEQQVHFVRLPETGKCVIRIFDLAGTPVRRIDHTDASTQFEIWDLRNNYGIPVASGMYVVHVDTDEGSKVLKLAVIQPEQRLDVY